MKKFTFLIIIMVILLLTACNKNENIPMKVIDPTTEKVTDVTTEKQTENVTEKSTELATVQPTEKATEKQTEAPTQVPTEVQTQAPTQASITKEQAINIAKELISKYEIKYNYGVCCDSVLVNENLYNYMTDYQKTWATAQRKCTCCNSIAQVKEHTYKYIAPEALRVELETYVFEHNNSVYIACEPSVYDRYGLNTLKLISFNNDSIVCECSLIGFDDMPYSTDKFTLTKYGDLYRITKVN